MQHYVVTGGAGFIGHHLVRELLKNDQNRVICLDNFDPFYSQAIKDNNIREFSENTRFCLLKTDLGTSTPHELSQAITEPVNAIIHLAAKAGVRPSIEDPLSYQQVNVIGTQNLLEFARMKQVKQFVFGSSSSVYGINNHFPWKENEALMPISPYAMTKLSGEMLGHVYSKLYGIRFIALRFFTVYGPAQRPDLAIHKFTKALIQDQPIFMFGDGSTSRDYTYVDDIIKGIISAIQYSGSSFEIINLGNNYSIPLKELVSALEQITMKKASIRHLPEQPGDVPKTFADIEKAKKLLNYHPETKLMTGLELFYLWFTENRELLLN